MKSKFRVASSRSCSGQFTYVLLRGCGPNRRKSRQLHQTATVDQDRSQGTPAAVIPSVRSPPRPSARNIDPAKPKANPGNHRARCPNHCTELWLSLAGNQY